MKQWHLAEVWEVIADTIPQASAVIEGDQREDWRTYEERSARIAAALAAAGLGFNSKVAIFGYNSKAYLEAQFGTFKIRGVPININYHYTESELEYILDNSDSEAIFFDARLGKKVAAVRDRLPKLKSFIEINDGFDSVFPDARRFEDLIAEFKPHPRQSYTPDDVFMYYTGGTTGSPKGVMFRHGDLIEICFAGYVIGGHKRPESAAELAEKVLTMHQENDATICVVSCPLMHAAGMWGGVYMSHNVGGAVVLFRNEKFDPDRIWGLAQRHRATDILIVGDAFARPMLKALEQAAADGRPYDLSALRAIFSSGAMFTKEVKLGLLSFADIVIRDTMGATEGSMAASESSRTSPPSDTARFMPNPTTKVFLEDGTEVRPGSGEIGLVANGGSVPIGYYKDPVKTAATFRMINGHRYGVPGDFAKVAADGSLIFLGRGSGCVNTGGEKVFPEEVEKVLSSHPSVKDCVVVGAPDERLGQRVVALVSLAEGAMLNQDEMCRFVRKNLAGYKVPKQFILVDQVRRAPNGKHDYKWAKLIVEKTACSIAAAN